ncbi:MAG: SHOCT domain-containing protein [Nocardioidaceae bacterium]|nr:SHOCT domain-containing protein [Nocardioidaceae bacterium]
MMTGLTPYEQLKSIKFQQQTQDRSGVGQVWAGGPLSSSQRRTVSLTIATDRKVHTLVTEHMMMSGEEKAGLALEAAGNGVLGTIKDAIPTQVSVVNPPVSPPAAPAQPDIADQIRKLAELHTAGVLTDEEFTAKKADLLDRM